MGSRWLGRRRRHGAVSEQAQRLDRWCKEILAGSHGNQLTGDRELNNIVGLMERVFIARAMLADDRIDAVGRNILRRWTIRRRRPRKGAGGKVCVVEPLTLHELELAVNVRHDAYKVKPTIHAVISCRARR